MKRGDRQNYNGRADLRHATARRAVETVARKLHQIVFPSEDFFNVLPKPGSMGSTIQNAEALKFLMRHYFDGQTDISGSMMPVFRQLALLGTTVVKSDWKHTEKRRKNRKGEWEEFTLHDCPDIIPIDIFRFYVFPWTVRRLEDAKLVFEEFAESEEYMSHMVDEGFYIKGAETEVQPFSKYTHDLNARLLLWGANDPSVHRDHNQKIYNLVETYFEMPVEKDGPCVPLMAHMDEFGNILMITDRPHSHGLYPYSAAKYVENAVPFFWGQGIMEVVESLAYEQNDTANQIMDNRTMALNPIAVIDPFKVRDHASLRLGPGAKWLADPDGVRFTAVPDLTVSGYNAYNMVKNEILEASDATPNMPAQMRGASRTAMRDQVMTTEMNSELSEFITQCCNMIKDMLKKTHSNIRQRLEDTGDEILVRILRKRSSDFSVVSVSADDIIGDFDYHFKPASEQSLDRVQVNQLITGIKVLSESGVKFNMENVARRLLRDGFGFDEYEEFMVSESLQPSMPQDMENKLLDMGKLVPVSPLDNDEEHLQVLKERMQKVKNQKILKVYQDHERRHTDGMNLKREILQREVMMARAEQEAQAMQMAGGPAASAESGPSGTPYQTQSTMPGDTGKGVR